MPMLTELESKALEIWASQVGCADINVEQSNEFARVWIACSVFAAAVFAMATVPFYWCSGEKVHLDPRSSSEHLKDVEDPSGKSSKGASTKPPRLGTGQTKVFSEAATADEREPNLEAATMHLKLTSTVDARGNWRPLLRTPLHEMSEIGGIGTELYFRLLRNLGVCFIYMAAVTSPIPAFSLAGKFAPDNGQAMVRTTIGNLGRIPRGGLIPEERYAVLGCQGIELTTLTKYFGWLDFAAVVIFLIFIAHFRFIRVPQMANDDDGEKLTASDFGVEIDCLPPDLSVLGQDQKSYEDLLRQHLTDRITFLRTKKRAMPTGDAATQPIVREIVLVRDFNGRLRSLRRRAELKHQRAIAEYKAEVAGDEKSQEAVDKLDHKISKITAHLEKKLKPEEELPVVRAYAILNSMRDHEMLLHDYRFGAYRLFRCCQYRARRFQGKALRILRAPEPSVIIWENQDMGSVERLLRGTAMLVIFLILIALSLVLIYATSVWGQSKTAQTHSYFGYDQCDPREFGDTGKPKCIAAEMTQYTVYNVTSNLTDCFCSVQGYGKIIENEKLRNFCKDWLLTNGATLGITIGATVIVMLINIVVRYILLAMAEFERPLSISELYSSMMSKMALVQTINTGFVVLLVNYYSTSKALIGISSVVPGGQLLFRGPYSDFVPEWYTTVGSALLANMLANVITPAITNVITLWLTFCCRRRQAKGARHQAELLQIYENPPFDISSRYAALLVTVFVCITYSSGMPLLYLFGAGYMFMTYWSDKLVLLWGSKRPPAFDSKMPLQASQLMLYALGLHCGFALMMYGQPCSFPSNPLGGKLTTLNTLGEQANRYGEVAAYISVRISRESTWMIAALFAVLVGLWGIWTVLWIIGSTFGQLWKCLRITCCPGNVRTAPIDADVELTWETAEAVIEKTVPPASYRMERNPEFSHIAKFLTYSGPELNTSMTSGFGVNKDGWASGSPSRPMSAQDGGDGPIVEGDVRAESVCGSRAGSPTGGAAGVQIPPPEAQALLATLTLDQQVAYLQQNYPAYYQAVYMQWYQQLASEQAALASMTAEQQALYLQQHYPQYYQQMYQQWAVYQQQQLQQQLEQQQVTEDVHEDIRERPQVGPPVEAPDVNDQGGGLFDEPPEQEHQPLLSAGEDVHEDIRERPQIGPPTEADEATAEAAPSGGDGGASLETPEDCGGETAADEGATD